MLRIYSVYFRNQVFGAIAQNIIYDRDKFLNMKSV